MNWSRVETWARKAFFWLAPHGLVQRYLTYRRRRDGQGLAQFRLPGSTLDELFPEIEKLPLELRAVDLERDPIMELPLAEHLTLLWLMGYCKPKRLFEIGTYTGRATLALAMASPPESTIVTLDLARNSAGLWFEGLPQADKIRTLYGNSMDFDFSPYRASMDFVLVDGDHTYPFVKVDSQNALQMVAPGGVVVWDDYYTESPQCAGVKQALEELQLPTLRRIRGTRLAIARF